MLLSTMLKHCVIGERLKPIWFIFRFSIFIYNIGCRPYSRPGFMGVFCEVTHFHPQITKRRDVWAAPESYQDNGIYIKINILFDKF